MKRTAEGYHVDQHTRDCVNEDVCNAIGCEDLGKYINFINESLGRVDLMLLNEDDTPFEGIFCGDSGRSLLKIGTWTRQPVVNSAIVFEWHKLSTRYDINCYMS